MPSSHSPFQNITVSSSGPIRTGTIWVSEPSVSKPRAPIPSRNCSAFRVSRSRCSGSVSMISSASSATATCIAGSAAVKIKGRPWCLM